jgi:hypothetical protein
MISPYGQKLVKEKKILDSIDDNLDELERLAESFFREMLNAFKALEII